MFRDQLRFRSAYTRRIRVHPRLSSRRIVFATLLAILSANPAFAAPPVTALAVAPEGNELLVGSQSGVHVRSLPSLDVVRALDTALAAIHEIVFSPDRKQLLLIGGTPGESGGYELHNWPSGELVLQRDDFDDAAYCGDWSAEGNEIAIAGDDLVIVYEGLTFADIHVLSGHSRRVLSARFIPDTDLLVSAGVDQSLRVFSRADYRSLRVLRNHTAEVYDLAVRPGDRNLAMIASCGADRTVRFWQPTVGRMVRFVRLDEAEPLAIAWTPDGGHLVAACTDGRLRVIDPQTADIVSMHPALSGWAYEVAVGNESVAVVGGADGELRIVQLDFH